MNSLISHSTGNEIASKNIVTEYIYAKHQLALLLQVQNVYLKRPNKRPVLNKRLLPNKRPSKPLSCIRRPSLINAPV